MRIALVAEDFGAAVEFVGRTENRSEHYQQADLYLCPTTPAGFGISLLEAMACGTPIVLAGNSGFRSVIGSGKEAVFLPHDDAGAWAQTILALAGDPARRQQMTNEGLNRVSSFAWPLVAQRILSVYQRVVSGRRG
jgi:glycosyltransferase involved in cell wall biosynthesis